MALTLRLIGGLMYLGGMLVMAWNVWMTVMTGISHRAPVPSLAPSHA